jgi:hypothetical protein
MEWRTYYVTPIDPVSESGTIVRVMQEMYISLSRSWWALTTAFLPYFLAALKAN